MKTTYPENIEIGFNRLILARSFLRADLVALTYGLCIPLMFLWLTLVTQGLEWVVYSSLPKGIGMVVVFLGASLAAIGSWVLLGLAYYLIWGKTRSLKRASEYSAQVEGPFLRIIDGRADRKIHFRQIGDYEAIRDKKAPELGMIRLRTNGMTATISQLNGIKDVLSVRDMLAEVDAERE